jgi:hypothetical protein
MSSLKLTQSWLLLDSYTLFFYRGHNLGTVSWYLLGMKTHSMGLFEFMRVYLTVTVGGKQKRGKKNHAVGLFENAACVFMER